MSLQMSVCWLLAIVISLSHSSIGQVSTISFLGPSDKAHLQKVFISNLNSEDLTSISYGILGLKLLQTSVPKEKDVCKFLLDLTKSTTSADSLYLISSAWKSLGQCQGSFPTADINKKLDAIISQDTATLADLYYASQALKVQGQKIKETAKVVKNIKNSLKKDDSLVNLGYAFHIANILGNEGAFIIDRIEDVIVQADEVDNKYLQFEGGLSTTALIISGIYQLSQSLNKPPTISGEQAVKFANYFISRRSVSTCKGGYHLLNVAKIFTSNKHHIPVAINLEGGVSVSLEQPNVKVSVTDILGNPLPNSLTITVESATKVIGNVVVASKLKFAPVPNSKTLYAVNFLEKKPEPGSYRFSVSATPTPADTKLVGNIGSALNVKVMCWVTLSDVYIGTADTDRTTKPRLESVSYPQKLATELLADSQQRIILQFALKDKQTAKHTAAHQTFVKFTNVKTQQEVILLAEPTNELNYKCDVDLGAKSAAFGHLSGVYTVSLIVGDAVVSNSFVWELARVNMKLSGESLTSNLPSSKQLYYKPKPEITHLFREPEVRPPVAVSNVFTILVLIPLIILFGLWGKLGVNISNFPFSISALGFHLCLGGIFVLFGFFWLQYYVDNMFETLKYLSFLSFFTFLFGNKLLSYIASSKKH